MKHKLGRLARWLGLVPDYVRFQGAVLPPARMRYCGPAFRDDATFLGSGVAEARRLAAEFGLGPATRMLEVGCGPGRLPIGIIAASVGVGRYDGVDLDARAIRWCRRHITRAHPTFRFHHIEVGNRRYNPGGPPMDASFRLPFPDQAYDLAYLYAVFTNLEPDDIGIYAREIHRLLRPRGQAFLTAFVEEDVPPFTVNPQDYLIKISGPLHVARYEKGFFLGLLGQGGLEVTHFGHRAEFGGQSVVHLQRPS